MRPADDILARLCIAYRERREIELQSGCVTYRTRRAGGVWRQPMIVGYAASYPHMMVRQWCRSVDEMIEQMEAMRDGEE